jgi:hypothetical protein
MERRESTRQACRMPVRIRVLAPQPVLEEDRILADPASPDDSFVLDSADLCPEGVFLHTELLFPVGEWLELEVAVPGRARPVRGRGRVIRVNASRKAPGPGVAVRLPALTREDRNALARMSANSARRAGSALGEC